ncbi:MAG: hypothetical protein JST92_21480, partial [Deltaproteobacteria bacterium]|nr:hypothetical protein [Deltaproteobacteria bacterium]
ARLCEELAQFFNPGSDGAVLAWDLADDPKVVAAAGACLRVFGARAETLIGRSVATLFRGGERAARDLVEKGLTNAATVQLDLLRPQGPNKGRPFAARLVVRGVPDEGAVALVRDLASSLQDADAVLRAEDVARFASLVAHEIRNPLSSVKIALQTLERGARLPPNDLRRVAIAVREVGSIETLLSEVLDYARPPTLSRVPLDPRGIVREAVAKLSGEWSSRGVKFKLRVPGRMSPVLADPTRVATAMSMLGAQAASVAEDLGGGEIEIRIQDGRSAWELRVLDPGPAVEPALRKKAFVPFTPSRARGSGLALAVVAQIAREHGGQASLTARRGHNEIVVRFER